MVHFGFQKNYLFDRETSKSEAFYNRFGEKHLWRMHREETRVI